MTHSDTMHLLATARSTGPARAVLLALVARSNNAGQCHPGTDCLARDAGLSRRATIDARRRLVALGEITTARAMVNTDHGPQLGTLYTVQRGAPHAPHHQQQGGALHVFKGVQDVHPNEEDNTDTKNLRDRNPDSLPEITDRTEAITHPAKRAGLRPQRPPEPPTTPAPTETPDKTPNERIVSP